jgi:hypothetical protein
MNEAEVEPKESGARETAPGPNARDFWWSILIQIGMIGVMLLLLALLH